MSRLIDADSYLGLINRKFPCDDKDDRHIRRATKLALADTPTIHAIPTDKVKAAREEIKALHILGYATVDNQRKIAQVEVLKILDKLIAESEVEHETKY